MTSSRRSIVSIIFLHRHSFELSCRGVDCLGTGIWQVLKWVKNPFVFATRILEAQKNSAGKFSNFVPLRNLPSGVLLTSVKNLIRRPNPYSNIRYG